MISCSHCREKLSEFLDQTLAPNEREQVAVHLKSCAECAKIARELENLRATLRDFTPVPAPDSLRQNVRAALQNEVKSRAPQPKFVWRPAQFAWTGTLTFAALTLMILARPFSQAPLSQAPISALPSGEAPLPEKAASQDENPKNQGQTPAKSHIQPAPNRKSQKTPPRDSQKSPQPKSAAPTLAPALRPENLAQSPALPLPNAPTENPVAPPRVARNSRNSSIPNAESSSGVAPVKRAAQPRSSVERAPQIGVRPTNPTPSPANQNLNGSPTRLQPARPEPAPSMLRKSPPMAPSPSRIQMPPSANSEAIGSAPRANLLRREAVASSARASSARFALVLKSVPFPAPVSSENALQSREAAPAAPPPLADAAKNPKSDAPQRARMSDGALGSVPLIGSLFRSKSAPAREIAKARIAPAPSARRFQLQIEAAQGVKGAQVRLEVPDSRRLLWPASKVVWHGDFVAGKAVIIEFSLSAGRGGEEISVILEQKTSAAQSSPLQTQTLILPASSD